MHLLLCSKHLSALESSLEVYFKSNLQYVSNLVSAIYARSWLIKVSHCLSTSYPLLSSAFYSCQPLFSVEHPDYQTTVALKRRLYTLTGKSSSPTDSVFKWTTLEIQISTRHVTRKRENRQHIKKLCICVLNMHPCVWYLLCVYVVSVSVWVSVFGISRCNLALH